MVGGAVVGGAVVGGGGGVVVVVDVVVVVVGRSNADARSRSARLVVDVWSVRLDLPLVTTSEQHGAAVIAKPVRAHRRRIPPIPCSMPVRRARPQHYGACGWLTRVRLAGARRRRDQPTHATAMATAAASRKYGVSAPG